MPILKVTVKHAGKKYENIELDTDQPGLVFKTQLFTLTGVAPERQKIMVKGGMLKDDANMNELGIKDGQQLMMMGTAGELPKAPETKIQFVEDMTDAQIAQALKLPTGLVNMGNTCYMNATLQCMRAISELQIALGKLAPSIGGNQRENLAVSMRTLFEELERSGESVPPLVFLQLLRSVFPQFAEVDRGGYMQQDAEECWGQIVSALSEKVPGLTSQGDVDNSKRFVEQFMTGELISSMTCDEAPEEPPIESLESFNKLRVNIGSGVSTYMLTDVAKSLEEKIEKNSPTLNRTAMYTKKSKVSRLPTYLACNFVRFQWRADIRQKTKILKQVKFPHDLDATELCTPQLVEKLGPARRYLKEREEALAAERKAKKAKVDSGDTAQGDDPSTSDSKKVLSFQDEIEKMKEIGVDASLYNDVGANVSGQYELISVLTHIGRAADSGHYIGWVKHGDNQWWKFDDDKVSQVSSEDIDKLQGGGEWHTAYICLYRAKRIV